MPEICEDMVGNRLAGLLVPNDGDPVGNAPTRFPLLFEHFPTCICYFVSIADKVSNTPQEAFPQELFGTFPNMPQHRFGHFLYIFFEALCFCLLR
jgi:hypothetical protein